MPTYEYRKAGRVVERVRPRYGGHEETRLGLAADENTSTTDGWVEVVEGAVPTEVAVPFVSPEAPKAGARARKGVTTNGEN